MILNLKLPKHFFQKVHHVHAMVFVQTTTTTTTTTTTPRSSPTQKLTPPATSLAHQLINHPSGFFLQAKLEELKLQEEQLQGPKHKKERSARLGASLDRWGFLPGGVVFEESEFRTSNCLVWRKLSHYNWNRRDGFIPKHPFFWVSILVISGKSSLEWLFLIDSCGSKEENLGGDFLMAVKVIFSFWKNGKKLKVRATQLSTNGVGLCIRNMEISYIISPYEHLNPPK